jgi:hypothetical protein
MESSKIHLLEGTIQMVEQHMLAGRDFPLRDYCPRKLQQAASLDHS